jgi:LPS-assembly lipoprotein
MTKFIQLSILLGLTTALVTGCGFEPMYGQHSSKGGASAQLSQVGIDIIPDKEGQSLRNHLIDRLYRNGYPSNPTATLKIAKVNETRTELDLTKSSDATRAQLLLTANMVLIDSKGTTVLTRSVQSITSFNILGSEFATRVTEEAARESALNDLARQIELNLSLYYNSK